MKETWFEFSRYHCLEGYIDVFIDDAAQDPNRATRAGYRLNATRKWFRLAGAKTWISDRDFKPNFFIGILNNADEMSAASIWAEYREVFTVKTKRVVMFPDEPDITPGYYRALIRDGFAYLEGYNIGITLDWVEIMQE